MFPLKPTYRVILFLIFLGCVLTAVSKLLDHAAKMDLREKAHWIISQKNKSYDFAVLGSSRSYVGVDVCVVETNLGMHGINLALDGTGYPEQFLALKLFLQKNKIEKLVLDVSAMCFDNNGFKFPFHAYEYLPEISDEVVFATLKDNFGPRVYAWRYIPFFKNAEFNSKLGAMQLYSWSKSFIDKRVLEAEFDQQGNRRSALSHSNANFRDHILRNSPKVFWTMDELPKKYFFEILKLAREKNISVTMIDMPEYYLSMEREANREEIMAFCEKVAATNNIPFLRFDRDPICQDRNKFYDSRHFRPKGVKEFSEMLAKRLATNGFQAAEIKAQVN